MLAVGIPATAQAADPNFTCRASALRVDTFATDPIEPFVANRDNPSCQTSDGSLIDEQGLPAGLGEASVLFARTDMRGNKTSTAEAGVLDATINAPQPIGQVRVEVLTSEATASCNRGTGEETFSGSSTIAAVDVAGQHVEPIPGQPQTITVPTGIVVVEFAKQVQTGEQITQQALVIRAVSPVDGSELASVVIGEAIADVHECEPPDKCNAGRGNGSEFVPPPTECDPGRSVKNKGGD